MKREKIVPIRFTQSEYQNLLDMAEEAGKKNNLSLFLREKIFSGQKEKTDFRETLFLIRQIRSDLNHVLKLYEKNFSAEAAAEMERCNELLKKMQKEMIDYGGNGAASHEGK